jgi:hypothetical protein
MPTGVHANPPIVQLTLEGELVTRLRREAAKRDTSAVALARAVLDVALHDHLLDAVLDDQAPNYIGDTQWQDVEVIPPRMLRPKGLARPDLPPR